MRLIITPGGENDGKNLTPQGEEQLKKLLRSILDGGGSEDLQIVCALMLPQFNSANFLSSLNATSHLVTSRTLGDIKGQSEATTHEKLDEIMSLAKRSSSSIVIVNEGDALMCTIMLLQNAGLATKKIALSYGQAVVITTDDYVKAVKYEILDCRNAS